MKAVVREKYGGPDVLHLEEVDRPTPADNQVLVEVRAASINRADFYELGASLLIRLISGGVRKPKNKIIGADIAGVVVEAGKGVDRLRPGDEVMGTGLEGFAEIVRAKQERLVPKPQNVTFDEGSCIGIAGTTALQGIRDVAKVQAGQKMLIVGASGGVGTFAIQIGKWYGAEVTAVVSTQNVEQAKAAGADKVVDYMKEDALKTEERYDVILGVNGYHSVLAYRRALAPAGRYFMIGSNRPIFHLIEVITVGKLVSKMGGRKLGFMGIAKLNQKDMELLSEMLASGKVKPVIERRYPLAQTPEAMEYAGSKHARGKVVVTVGA